MSTERLTRDTLKAYGLTRSKLASLLGDVERLAAASREAHQAFADARNSRQSLPQALARRASEAATAGEEIDLAEHATDAETVLMAAQAKAKGTQDAHDAALGKVAEWLRSEDGADARAKAAQVLEERRTVALERLEAARAAIVEVAEAVAVVEAIAAPNPGVRPTLSLTPPDRHPLHRAAQELAAQVAGAGPKAPARQPVSSGYTARLGA